MQENINDMEKHKKVLMNSKLTSWTCVSIIQQLNIWIGGIYSPFLTHRGSAELLLYVSLYYQVYATQIGMG